MWFALQHALDDINQSVKSPVFVLALPVLLRLAFQQRVSMQSKMTTWGCTKLYIQTTVGILNKLDGNFNSPIKLVMSGDAQSLS